MTTRRHSSRLVGAATALGALRPLAALARSAQTRSKILLRLPGRRHRRRVSRRVAEKLGSTRLHQERGRGREQARRRRPHRGRSAQGIAGRRLGAGCSPRPRRCRSIRTSTPSSPTRSGRVAPVSIGAVMIARPRRRPGGAGGREDPEGLPGLGQGQSGAGQLRLARRRLDAALPRRPARPAQPAWSSSTCPTAARRPAVKDLVGGQIAASDDAEPATTCPT